MIAGFSLGTRRFIAAGLALLLVLLALQWIVVPMIATIAAWRDELALLEAREARLLAARSWPDREAGDAPIAAWLVEGSEAEARDRLIDHVTGIAAAQGLEELRTGISVEERDAGRAYILSLSVSGPHDAVMQLISGIERGSPLLRARSLSIVPVPARESELAVEIELEAVGRKS